ncbi:NAD-dependent epimerase/dehydratase family protein [[Mycobacterium] wendilense]|uniref:NAD-dependent epimerase/dehydratase family protein n=1 Tax=[Mycobacterium] wendilense TaxID=3064284 RepID=A0ABM9MDL8_9MYCO|nr:NAD-dependent epimerase/dehydratase family protein [Mycolicibacterium sp. MU0050]CAJ1582667.1 NAD-dependent epimerase/dehydratase family protein [Mycolicibacterium sp. MU0050]
MKIVITGATSALGRAAATQLSGAGHRVTGVAQQPHPCLDPGVDLTCMPLDSPALRDVVAGADAVIHLAPVEPGGEHSEGLIGLLRVADATARAGARLLFVSQAAGDPLLYGRAEELVSSSWAPSLVIRCAALLGRRPDWAVSRTVATVRGARCATPIPVLHIDDLCRFLVRSVGSHRTGTVDLAAPAPLPASSARRWLGRVKVRRAPAWTLVAPAMDVAALQRDWEFTCGWTAADAWFDAGRLPAGDRWGHAEPLARARAGIGGHAASAAAGEFDDVIDPRFAVFDTRGSTDALPGPLTPMSLDVQFGALRAAQRATGEILGLRGDLAEEWQRRGTAVFGHRLFTGRTVSEEVAAAIGRTGQRAALLPRAVAVARDHHRWCAAYAAQCGQHPRWAGESDAVLDTRMLLLRDQIQHGWALAGVGAAVEGLLAGAGRPGPPATAEITAARQWADGTATLELANPLVAEVAVAKVVPSVRASRSFRMAEAVGASRGVAWGAAVFFTNELRGALCEKGSRLAARRMLASADDVFYLTLAEAVTPPADARLRVARRRAERERLQALNMPDVIDGWWSPLPDAAPAPASVAGEPNRMLEPAAVALRRVSSMWRDRAAFGT